MSRSQEFSVGATFKEKAPDGSETVRSAIAAVGGTRNEAQVKKLPGFDKPTNPYADPSSSYYGAAGSLEGPDLEYEKRLRRRE